MQILTASRYQKRFFVEWKLNPKSISYNTVLAFEIFGELNRQALHGALNQFIHDYDEGCRSYFLECDDLIQQVIIDQVQVDIEYTHLHELSDDVERIRSQFINNTASHIFDLEKFPLFKFGVLNINPNHSILVLNFHHIISDGVTAGYFLETLSNLYNAYFKSNMTQQNKIASIAEYLLYEKENYPLEKKNNDLIYWEDLLKDADLCLNLPALTNAESNIVKYKSLYFEVQESEASALRKTAREQGTSIFILLGAIFSILLLRYTHQKSLIFNYPVNMRPPRFSKITGCYVNNLLFKVETYLNQSFKHLLDDMTTQRKQTKKHQLCSLIDVVHHLRDKKILKGTQFFNVHFYEAFLGLLPLSLNGLNITPIQINQGEMTNDIGLAYEQVDKKIKFKLEYKTAIFDDDIIKDFITQFHALIEKVNNDINVAVHNYSLLSTSNYHLVTKEFNKTFKHIPEISICSLIESISHDYPENIAIIHSSKSISYIELNSKANKLANHLKSIGVDINTYVGIYLERSFDLIISILAVLKTGAAYIPLDPKNPQQHLESIIHDAALSFVVTNTQFSAYFDEKDITVINIDKEHHKIEAHSSKNLPLLSDLRLAAYVIYTSGSTGKPKGVVVTHRSLVNHNYHIKNCYAITKNDKVLQFSSISFDISVEEIFPTLISGASLVLYPDHEGISIKTLHTVIQVNQITYVNLPTAFWHTWLSEIDEKNILDLLSLRLVVVGGEQAQLSTLMQWKKLFGKRVEWINTYGPTEATVIASLWKYSEHLHKIDDLNTIPIGKPIANCQLYILDAMLHPVPFGSTGELYIAGETLARCYLNQPGMTAEKFIPNPFSHEIGERMYKTGDLARYHRDGAIECIGRIDDQVKIRGFRVELSAVESVLVSNHNVKSAVVIKHVVENAQVFLVAYVVMYHLSDNTSSELKKYLSEKLPDYMVPLFFIYLKTIPLTTNGKINKKALPIPSFDENKKKNIISATTNIEKKLVDIWQVHLNTTSLSIEDNYFDLGAHSLLMLKVHKRIEEVFNLNLSVIKLFEYPTIKSFAAFLSAQNDSISDDSQTQSYANKQRLAFEKQRKIKMRSKA